MENVPTGVVVVLTTTLLVSIAAYFSCKHSPWGHSNWRRVGTLEEILFYPLKSGAAVSLNSASCDIHGMQAMDPECYRIQDRCFVTFSPSTNTILTVRDYPKLVLLKWRESGDDSVTFEAPGMSLITVAKPTCTKESRRLCKMWNGDEIYVMDFGDEPASWLTTFLNVDELNAVRLGYFCPKFCQGRNFGTSLQILRDTFPNMSKRDFGVYCDSVPYTLLTEATMDELKKRLGGLHCIVETRWFRPSFVVSNSTEFEEDTWNYIKIGGAVFQNVIPCRRDPSCCVNPNTGQPTENGEPFLTLRKFRCGASGGLERECSLSRCALPESGLPAFGVGLGLRQAGSVNVGDPVFVSDVYRHLHGYE